MTERAEQTQPCPTCGRAYGVPVDQPDRCGCCLTGLSLDGRPVHPVHDGERWVSPITGGEVLQLPDGTWTFYIPWPRDFTREQAIAEAVRRRAADHA